MIVNIVFLSLTFTFIIYCAWSAIRKFIDYNPNAPSLWKRIKPKLKAFAARWIIDDGPVGEDHAKGRYPIEESAVIAPSAWDDMAKIIRDHKENDFADLSKPYSITLDEVNERRKGE